MKANKKFTPISRVVLAKLLNVNNLAATFYTIMPGGLGIGKRVSVYNEVRYQSKKRAALLSLPDTAFVYVNTEALACLRDMIGMKVDSLNAMSLAWSKLRTGEHYMYNMADAKVILDCVTSQPEQEDMWLPIHPAMCKDIGRDMEIGHNGRKYQVQRTKSNVVFIAHAINVIDCQWVQHTELPDNYCIKIRDIRKLRNFTAEPYIRRYSNFRVHTGNMPSLPSYSKMARQIDRSSEEETHVLPIHPGMLRFLAADTTLYAAHNCTLKLPMYTNMYDVSSWYISIEDILALRPFKGKAYVDKYSKYSIPVTAIREDSPSHAELKQKVDAAKRTEPSNFVHVDVRQETPTFATSLYVPLTSTLLSMLQAGDTIVHNGSNKHDRQGCTGTVTNMCTLVSFGIDPAKKAIAVDLKLKDGTVCASTYSRDWCVKNLYVRIDMQSASARLHIKKLYILNAVSLQALQVQIKEPLVRDLYVKAPSDVALHTDMSLTKLWNLCSGNTSMSKFSSFFGIALPRVAPAVPYIRIQDVYVSSWAKLPAIKALVTRPDVAKSPVPKVKVSDYCATSLSTGKQIKTCTLQALEALLMIALLENPTDVFHISDGNCYIKSAKLGLEQTQKKVVKFYK